MFGFSTSVLQLPTPVAGLVLLVSFCHTLAAENDLAGHSKLKPHPKALANPHKPGEVDKPELVKFIIKHPADLPGVVVDETQAELVGEWKYSTHTPPYVGLGYLHDQKKNKGKSSVTFRPDLPHSGVYEVRLSHCYNVRRSTNTPVTIHYADGDKTVRINQQQVPKFKRLFRSLGQFRFEAGKKGWVRISTDKTDGKYVIADAVQFLYVEPNNKDRKKQGVAPSSSVPTPKTEASDSTKDN